MEFARDTKTRGAGRTVLVVDDNAAIRKMLASAFLSDGFEFCIEAENGKEGIEAARQRKIDLIILDLSMPVMNGLQAAPELRMLLPHTPIILFTLYADSLPHKDTAAAGVTIVLAKGTPLLLIVEKAHELMRN